MRMTRLMVALLLVIAGVVVVAHLSSSTLEFSRYNYQWNGTSALCERLEETDAIFTSDLSVLSGAENALLLVVAPGDGFSADESARIREFIERGNLLFLAAESGAGNSLLRGIGCNITIQPGSLGSVDSAYDDPGFIVVSPQANDTIIEGIITVTLNSPVALDGGTTLLATSLLSWRDENGNGRVDHDESLSSYPVFAKENLGEGAVYVLSDPSVFINSMQDLQVGGDNGCLMSNALSAAPNIIVEEEHSRIGATDGFLDVMFLVQNKIIIKLFIILLTTILLIYVYHRRFV